MTLSRQDEARLGGRQRPHATRHAGDRAIRKEKGDAEASQMLVVAEQAAAILKQAMIDGSSEKCSRRAAQQTR